MSTLRTLVIAPNLPYPTFFGVDLRNWQNITGLMSLGQVGVFGVCSNDPRRDEVPRTDLAFWRCSTDPALTYPLPQGQKLAARAWLFDPLGHPSDLYYSDTAAAEITAIVKEFRPQIIVLEGLWLHRYTDPLKPFNCRIVLDCHNVEATLSRQMADATVGDGLPAKLMRDILPARVKLIEQQATQAVDQLWVCSSHDARLMQELYKPSAAIHIVPNAVDVDSYAPVRTNTCRPPAMVNTTKQTLIFPAMFAYPPSIGATTFLIDEIFPRLITIFADCQLLLVGSLPTPQMREASKRDPRIVVTGTVPDIRPYLAAASIMVVPLFQGSGTRFKILEAFAAQVPVVSTAKGAEGLDTTDGMHLLIAESADEFVSAIQRLWTDENLARRLTTYGLELVKQYYSWEETNRRIEKAITELTSHNITTGRELMLTPQQRLSAGEEVAAKVIDGEAIIINLANGIYYSLDKAGGMIWEMLEAGHCPAEVIEATIARYDVSREQAQAEVDRLATELLQENLLKVADDRTPPRQPVVQEAQHKLPYETPVLNIYRDMGDLLALDPPTPGFQEIAWKEPKEE